MFNLPDFKWLFVWAYIGLWGTVFGGIYGVACLVVWLVRHVRFV